MSNVTGYGTTLTSGEAIQVLTDSTIGYPELSLTNVFGTVYLPRIYAKDLSALEIASSGKIIIALDDEDALEIVKTTTTEGDPTVSLVVHDSMSLETPSSSIFMSATKCNLEINSMNDISITCANNIYMNAKNLIIDVSNMSMSYAFAVADTGELQLQQHYKDTSGMNNVRIVARFGVKHGTAQTASNNVFKML